MYLDMFNFRINIKMTDIYVDTKNIHFCDIARTTKSHFVPLQKYFSAYIYFQLTVYSLSSHTFVFVTDAQIYDHFPSMVHRAGNFCQFKYWSHQITQHESCDRWCMSRQIRGRNETCNKNLSLLYASFAWLDVFQVTNFHTYLIQS